MATRSRMATTALVASAAIFACLRVAAETVTVGGAPMYPGKNIVDNAVASKDHTTLVAAVKAAGLVQALEGAGPFTVFAPTNEAFARLPTGSVETLLAPGNNGKLAAVLTYHVVPGRLTSIDLAKLVNDGGGSAKLKTIEGDFLTLTIRDKTIDVADPQGDVAKVTIADVMQSNGVIHVVDRVLLPQPTSYNTGLVDGAPPASSPGRRRSHQLLTTTPTTYS